MPKNPSFIRTHTERKLIAAVITRAESLGIITSDDLLGCEMDLAAANANGTPLDFAKLLNLPSSDFSHDISGINQNIDMETGKLTNNFRPKCARPASGTA